MNLKINAGKDIKSKDIFIDLQKENLHTIILTGSTGSGKSIFHYSFYKQLMEQNLPTELGFVFMDMTQVDFSWRHSPYLYLPTITNPGQALNALELLANENKLNTQDKSDSKRAIVIHIEECDMVAADPIRFEKAWLKIAENKDKSKMYLVFSTSRPSPDVLTKTILKNTDLKVVFNLASIQDSKHVIGESLAENFTLPGQKVLVFKGKKIICEGFTDMEVKEINKFDEDMNQHR